MTDSVPDLVPQDDAGRKRKDAYLKRTYGITLEDFEILLTHQCNRCAVCARVFVKPPHVDHDHKTGTVRGLLDAWCNRYVIGRHRDPEVLKSAGEYLEHPPAVAVLGEITVPPKKPKKRRPRKRA